MSDEANDRVNPSADGDQPSEEETPELSKLPPPAFPPGSRRQAAVRAWAQRRQAAGGGAAEVDDEFEEAFISPDEPIVRRKHPAFPDDAFISPDEPIVRTGETQGSGAEEAVVTGIGGQDAGGPVYPQSSLVQSGKEVRKLADLLETLARDLRDEGTQSLRVEEGMPRFQAMLRSMLAGYLAGKSEG